MSVLWLSNPQISPVGTLAPGNYRNYFLLHSLVRRASWERSTEEALKRTLCVVPWYRARIAPAVLTRADFNRAKARSTGTIATMLLAQRSGAFPHGP
jgi:hypothetical protein